MVHAKRPQEDRSLWAALANIQLEGGDGDSNFDRRNMHIPNYLPLSRIWKSQIHSPDRKAQPSNNLSH